MGAVSASPAALTQSVARSLAGDTSMRVLRIRCVTRSLCKAAFDVQGDRLEMEYRVGARISTPTCWVLTEFSVTRPVPRREMTTAPLPKDGCTDR
jgi:hypothetical protein